MKIELIMLDQPILVSDEEITLSDTLKDCFYFHDGRVIKRQYSHHKEGKKIIAGIPELPTIDFSALSGEDCKRIGIAHSNDEWITELTKDIKDEHTLKTAKLCLRAGFNKAQSLNEKKFSEEDLLKAWRAETRYLLFEDFLADLSQPKLFDVEVDKEDKIALDGHTLVGTEPKITNNTIKIIRVL